MVYLGAGDGGASAGGDAPSLDTLISDAEAPPDTAPSDLGSHDIGSGDVGAQDAGATDTGGPVGVDSVLPVCSDQTVSIANIALGSVLFVVDRSQSMKGQTWTDAQSAITSITANYDATLRFGMILSPTEDSVCTVSTALDVPFGPQNAAVVGSVLDTAVLRKGTPTGPNRRRRIGESARNCAGVRKTASLSLIVGLQSANLRITARPTAPPAQG